MNDETNQYYLDILSSLKEVECETCQKSILVRENDDSKYECQNCYITKLELLEYEKKNSKKLNIFDVALMHE